MASWQTKITVHFDTSKGSGIVHEKLGNLIEKFQGLLMQEFDKASVVNVKTFEFDLEE